MPDNDNPYAGTPDSQSDVAAGRSPSTQSCAQPVAPPAPPTRGPDAGPHAPHPDLSDSSRRTSSGILWLGIALLIGAILPFKVSSPEGALWAFPTSLIFRPSLLRRIFEFMCLYFLLAGVAVMVLGAKAWGLGRSIPVLCLGLVPIFVLIGSEDARRLLGDLIHGLGEIIVGEERTMTVGSVITLLAWICILSGSRALHFRPGSLAAALLGVIGGGLYILTRFLPIAPEEMGVIPILTPFRLLKDSDTVFLGGGLILGQAFTLTASILCIVAALRLRSSGKLWAAAFRWLIGGAAAALFGLFGTVFSLAGDLGGQGMVEILLLTLVKCGASFIPLLLLIPVGVTDLMVNFVPVRTGDG